MQLPCINNDFQEIKNDLKIKDISGKELDALTVFSRSIQFFREDFLATKANTLDIKENEMGWIITVPAIWSDSAKKFMRQAAEKVRILCCSVFFHVKSLAFCMYDFQNIWLICKSHLSFNNKDYFAIIP